MQCVNAKIWSLFLLLSLSDVYSDVQYAVFSECDPRGVVSGDRHFTICAFSAISTIDLQTVGQVYSYYTQVRAHAAISRTFNNLFFYQGKCPFVGKSVIPTIKVKRNQFTSIIGGLRNHDFGYVVYGDLTIFQAGSYTICTRSDDG